MSIISIIIGAIIAPLAVFSPKKSANLALSSANLALSSANLAPFRGPK
jgi:hypothetical protein